MGTENGCSGKGKSPRIATGDIRNITGQYTGVTRGDPECTKLSFGPESVRCAAISFTARRGMDGSFAHPFGSLAAIHVRLGSWEGPWLCVTGFRRLCPFEDE